MRQTVLFLDLDDTIFQTRRKNPHGLTLATRVENPELASFHTCEQQLLLNTLLASELVSIVPTTARDLEQYNRTMISGYLQVPMAILNFSGTVLDGGLPDQVWAERISHCYRQMATPLEQVHVKVLDIVDTTSFNVRCVGDYYISIKNISRQREIYEAQNLALYELLKQWEEVLSEEYFIHCNDNNLSIVPAFLDKQHAVKYVIEKLQPELTIGIGDSVSDLAFMGVCHFQLFPSHSQIDRQLLRAALK